MKFCADCKHYYWIDGTHCDHPSVMDDHPVYGRMSAYPLGARQEGGKCGPEAKFFELRPPRPGFLARVRAVLCGNEN